ncbi:MAG: response regulator [Cytophagales bacterium]|nr:response regulator [Cytophagales bacterium]
MKTLETVLIVEDDPIAAMIVGKKVNAHPRIRQSRTCANGELALSDLKAALEDGNALPDLILLDINMPVMDGWQFLAALAALPKPREVPVVMLTSSIDSEDMARARTFPAVRGFFSKPLSAPMLDQVLALVE